MKRTTWVLLILLVIVTGVYYLVTTRAKNAAVEEVETPVMTSYLIEVTDNTLNSLRIYDKDYHIVELQRDQDGYWSITLPTPEVADQALMMSAETQLYAMRIVAELGKVDSLADFGLAFPAYTIKLTFMDGRQNKIEVGNSTPTNSGYYVQLDDGEVFVVSINSIDSLLTLLSNPPYQVTAVPTH